MLVDDVNVEISPEGYCHRPNHGHRSMRRLGDVEVDCLDDPKLDRRRSPDHLSSDGMTMAVSLAPLKN